MHKKLIFIILILLIQIEVKSQLAVSNSTTIFVQDADLLFVVGDVENSGTISHLTLSGSLSQSLSGDGNIGGLKINKSSGIASILSGSNQRITTSLDLTSGILSSNGSLTLKSTSSGSASVLSHTTSGSITGNVNVEKYIDVSGRPHQWRNLGFPYSTSIALSSITGFSMDFTDGSRSVMYFNEGADNGAYGATGVRNTGYVSFISPSESISPGFGVMAWIYGNTGGRAGAGTMSGGITVLSSGVLNESGSDVSLPVTYNTSPVNPSNRGWNLVSNPFVSTLDWNSANITRSNVGGSIYRWNPASASWTTYNGLTGTPSGVGRYIESGSSFFVLATGASPQLTISQLAKTETSPGFIHLRRAPRLNLTPGEKSPTGTTLSGIRLSIVGQGNPMPDEAFLDISRSDAGPLFDDRYDASSMVRSSGPGISVVDSLGKSYAMQFDRPIDRGSARYYQLKVTAPFNGVHSIRIRKEGSWDKRHSIALIDQVLKKTMLLQQDSMEYFFIPEAKAIAQRFVLAINHVANPGSIDAPNSLFNILGNPVVGNKLYFHFLDSRSSPRKWQILDLLGQKVAHGVLPAEVHNIQYQITLPASMVSGSYLLSVETDAGTSLQQVFIKQ